MKKLTVLTLAVLLAAGAQSSALAGGHEGKIKKYVNDHVRVWIGSDELIQAVHQQNINHTGLTNKDIDNLDTRWRTERRIGGGDLVASKMNNHLSSFLRGIKAASGGVITEIFVMDDLGLNVG